MDGRNIHVQSTSNGNNFIKFESDFGIGKGVAQDSVFMGNIRLVSDEKFQVDGAGSSAAARELSLLRAGLAGGGAATEATSDLRGDGTLTAGVNYDTAIAHADVIPIPNQSAICVGIVVSSSTYRPRKFASLPPCRLDFIFDLKMVKLPRKALKWLSGPQIMQSSVLTP